MLINDYNHWMLGIDVIDQRIAYYHPDLRCRRNWLPMFVEFLSLVQNNSYVVHVDDTSIKTDSHLVFLCGMIRNLMEKAYYYRMNPYEHHYISCRRNAIQCQMKIEAAKKALKAALDAGKKTNQHLRVSDFAHVRYCKPLTIHGEWFVEERKPCVVCSTIYESKKETLMNSGKTGDELKKELEKLDWHTMVKRTKQTCRFCSSVLPCHLCDDHFDAFHAF